METGPLPLIGQVWLLSGFDFDRDPYATEPGLFAADGETPLLTVPEGLEGTALDDAFCVAIVRLFVKRYGVLTLVQGIRSWDAIVAGLGQRSEEAAD